MLTVPSDPIPQFLRRPGIIDVSANMLGAHVAVGAAVRFSGDDRDLRRGRLGKRREQFSAVMGNAAMLLIAAGGNPGTSSNVMIGMLKRSQKRTL